MRELGVRFPETRHSALPVVSRANARKIVGIITISDILAVYGVTSARDVPPAKETVRVSA